MLTAMSFKPYRKKTGSPGSVAVQLGRTAVYAPEHELWGVVTCDECNERFVIGPHRIHGSRIGEQDCARRLEALLSEDHKQNKPHVCFRQLDLAPFDRFIWPHLLVNLLSAPGRSEALRRPEGDAFRA